MYKDFKKSETLDTGFTSGNSLLWMFSGIVLGLVVGLGLYFFTNDKIPSISMIDSLEQKIQSAQKPNQQQAPAVENKINRQQVKTAKTVEVEKERKNKFSYYAVLPNLDVPVGSSKPINTSAAAASVAVKNMDKTTEKSLSEQYEEAVAKQNSQDAQPSAVEETNNNATENDASIGDYLLQVASFKKQSMADKTKGRLSNKGIDAYIQKKKIKGRYWYRVVAGPVDQTNINSWKSTAEQLGHKPLVISVR